MKRNKAGWEKPRCNLCGSDKYDVVWDDATSWLSDGTYKIVQCRHCSLTYLSPRPTEKIIGQYYKKESYWGTNIVDVNNKQEKSLRDSAYGMLYKDIFRKAGAGSILDIGAGTGFFLTKFKEKDWEVRGVEISRQACEFARKVHGVKLDRGDFLDKYYPKNYFDVVTLNGCLEHLHKPKETLKKIAKVLKKDGLLLITVPNFDSLGRRIFGKEWYALQPPTHLYHFTPKTIKLMLNDSGFKVRNIKHSYWQHNYYIIFESIRMLFSPKFNIERMENSKSNDTKRKKRPLYFEGGKALAKVVSTFAALLMPVVKKGEVISVYAEKF